MASAKVGDDLFGEDPTVNRLQEMAAELFEREDALFVPSGTMANQIAVRVHTSPGQEVIVEARSHMFDWEMAMMAALSGCQARPVEGLGGLLNWAQIEKVISPPVYYRAQTGLLALENTHNMAGGTVMTSEQVVEQGRSGATDVQVTCRAGCETNPHGMVMILSQGCLHRNPS